MAKTIKISLVIDGCKCRSIEDVRNNFNLMEVVDNFQSGKLLKWAKSRENKEFAEKLSLIMDDSPLKQARELCLLFSIDDITESDLQLEMNSLVVYQRLESGEDFLSVTKKMKNSLIAEFPIDIRWLLSKRGCFDMPEINERYVKIDIEGKELERTAVAWKSAFDSESGLTWQLNEPGDFRKTYQWGKWNMLIDRFNQEVYCGHTDWRVPTLQELTTILSRDVNSERNFINAEFFPDLKGVNEENLFWTSTVLDDVNDDDKDAIDLMIDHLSHGPFNPKEDTIKGHVISFKSGKSKMCSLKEHAHVRLVRG
ncbi:MAG: DUF1566 domain-containing protein [Candidatus Marinimicrobia bacterium]|jgi:hypothetical protein|nr:DUF1566 domain-containing protein [Candidatus Neomarinimicrobiota bacterium]